MKKVLISGGSKGIGKEIALTMYARDYDVTSFARSKSDQGDTEHYRHISGIDVRDFKQLESLDLGSFDCMVNNVGIAYDGILATQSLENIEDLIHVNLTSVIYLTKLYIRERLAKRKAGTIVNISSIIGVRGYSGLAVYSATKAGIDGMTRALAREMGPKGFRINSVLPGYVDTDMSKNLSPAQRQQIIRRTPLGRLATAKDIALAVEFLVSDKSQFITGQSLVVDGGITI